jgi:hypothetical protein
VDVAEAWESIGEPNAELMIADSPLLAAAILVVVSLPLVEEGYAKSSLLVVSSSEVVIEGTAEVYIELEMAACELVPARLEVPEIFVVEGYPDVSLLESYAEGSADDEGTPEVSLLEQVIVELDWAASVLVVERRALEALRAPDDTAALWDVSENVVWLEVASAVYQDVVTVGTAAFDSCAEVERAELDCCAEEIGTAVPDSCTEDVGTAVLDS